MELRHESRDTSPTRQHTRPLWFFLQRQLGTCEAENNSIMGKLDEGLDDFFYKKVIKVGLK